MANTKSAIKRVRKISRQTTVNKSRKSKFKTVLKKMNAILSKKDKKEALAFLPKLNSELMKIAKTGVIKKQNAARNVSRITKKIKVEGSANPENSHYFPTKAELMNCLLLLNNVTALTAENDSYESQSAD